MKTDGAFYTMDRCQSRDCPLTGFDNCNHAVVPGCKQFGKSFPLDRSNHKIALDAHKTSECRRSSASHIRAHRESRTKSGISAYERPFSFQDNLKPAVVTEGIFSLRNSTVDRRSKTRNDGKINAKCDFFVDELMEEDDIPDFKSDFENSGDDNDQSDVHNSNHNEQSASCCDCRDRRSTCAKQKAKCACRRAGRECYNCLPLSLGKCSNCSIGTISSPELRTATQLKEPFMDSQTEIACSPESPDQNQDIKLVDIKMKQAFGVPLLNSDGKPRDDQWGKIWERLTKLRGKLYTLPGGATAKRFISLYEREINAFVDGQRNSESFVCFPSLILQKDKNFKKTKDIRSLLKRRMTMWDNGQFDELIKEAEQCDRKLSQSSGKMNVDQEAKVFSSLIMQGKLREAVRFITDRQGGGVMSPEQDAGKPAGKSVFEVLLSKHPEQRIPEENDFLECAELPPLINVDLTSAHVEQAARKLSGGAGISGFDSYQLQRILLRYGNQSEKLRDSFARATEKQANSILKWEEIRALKAKRLIALNKLPGVRPIGIGESPDRCFEKIMSIVTGEDVMEVCGSDQLCSGVKSGIEAAIHGLSQSFEAHCNEGWGLLLTDAENAFNSISRPVFLWNARILWTRCSRFLFNSYRGYAVLVLRGSKDFLFSKEGCTQGSGCAMQAYAIGILPMIKKLKNPERWIQI